MINKSKKFFKEADNFQLEDFAEKVIEDKDVITSYSIHYTKLYDG